MTNRISGQSRPTALRTLRTAGSLVASVVLSGSLLVGVADASSRGSQVKLDHKLHVHPLLQYAAQMEPDKRAHVLVRKDNAASDSHAIAGSVGDTVKEEFRSINTLAMDVPLKAVEKLASNPHVRYVSPDAPVRLEQVNTDALLTSYPGTIGLGQVWNDPLQPTTGKGVSVAVLDSGLQPHPDLPNVTSIDVNLASLGVGDQNGHGTHVIGILNGRSADGHYVGVAPDARVISIKVSDANGMAHESDVLRGLQWVEQNAKAYSIRAVNLSINSGTAESYATSALDAAVEQLWFSGVTVVVAAGNRGSATDATWYPPANDPYVVSVGALDDNQTAWRFDDSLASFSSRGVTQDGFTKPDVLAPGRKIAAPAATGSTLVTAFPERVTPDGQHLLLSGTSMAAPVVSGVVALLLQRFPSLTPDQIKWLVTQRATAYPGMLDRARVVAPSLEIATALIGALGKANVGLVPSHSIDPSTGAIVGNTAFWDTAFWDTCFWDTASTFF
jgi:serine protease AprX